jgi:membrane associated rhomboid family serine protease
MIPLKDDHPLSVFPLITITFIVLNVFVFLHQSSLGQHQYAFVLKYGSIPWEITHNIDQEPLVSFPVWGTLVTSTFLHGGWFHLIGNMLYFWIFGKGVEDAMGYWRFVVFYLLCGIIADISHIMTAPNSRIPAIGASGAISGVLGAYLVLYPTANILTVVVLLGSLIRILPIPAVLFLIPWIILQVLHGAESVKIGSGCGIAWFAHIGGFVAGLCLVRFFKKE